MASGLVIQKIVEMVDEVSHANYGNHSLHQIYGAGQTEKPKLALVFINPTYRNISTSIDWGGLRAPWIGCKDLWKFLTDAGVFSKSLNTKIQRSSLDWSEDFAEQVYKHVVTQGIYITNTVKWAGLNAKLPERQKVDLFAPSLIKELATLQPRGIIAFGQLTFENLLRTLNLKTPLSFGKLNEQMLADNKLIAIESSLGAIIPCYFPLGQGIKNRSKAIKILQMAYGV